MNNRQKKTQFLIDELGLIDDSFLEESSDTALLHFKKKKKRAKTLRLTALLFAAVISLFALFAVAANVVIGNLSQSPNDSTAVEEPSVDCVDLFDGKKKICWQDGAHLYAKEISGQSYQTLLVLTKQGGKKVGAASETSADFQVWFTNGDGVVISPYLSYSRGNIGYGTLFSYEKEIEPSEELLSLLLRLIGKDLQA